MDKLGNTQYECRNQVNWKAVAIMMVAIAVLWALVLFIPRRGDPGKNIYFYLLLSFGLGIELLILYSGLLRRWAKTWIVDGVVHSDFSSRLMLPISRSLALADVREICFIFNASLRRKTIANPSLKAFRQMRERLGEKIDAIVSSREPTVSVALEDDRYSFPAYCGRLILSDGARDTLPIDLNVTLFQANPKEVRKFISFLPKDIRYTWRYGRVTIRSKGSMF